MYYQDDREQVSMEEFFQPFGGRLRRDNRWVIQCHGNTSRRCTYQNLSRETGRPAISSRIAFRAIFIKEYCHITDDDTVQQLQENSYMKYETIAEYSNTKFRGITGVKRATFEKMVENLRKGYAEKHRHRGRTPKPSMEDLLLATLR